MLTNTKKQITCLDLGLVDYNEAYSVQQGHVRIVMEGGQDTLLLCEHPAVLTAGRLAKQENVLCGQDVLDRMNIKVVSVDRGGDVTLHSPGQLVAYFICNLNRVKRDLRQHLFRLEQVAIDFLAQFGILACRNSLNTGAWAGGKKIASVGIGARKWITYHGLAVNVNTDLSLFSLIKPCDLNVEMTSIRQIKGIETDMGQAKVIFQDVVKNIM